MRTVPVRSIRRSERSTFSVGTAARGTPARDASQLRITQVAGRGPARSGAARTSPSNLAADSLPSASGASHASIFASLQQRDDSRPDHRHDQCPDCECVGSGKPLN